MSHPEQLIEARYVKTRKSIFYILFLSLIITLPVWIETTQTLNEFIRNGQEIAENIPSFTIENDELVPQEQDESFIYQTNSIIFAFDPNGKISSSDMDRRVFNNTIGFSLLENNLYLSIPLYPMEIPYSQLNGLDDVTVKEIILNMQDTNPLILLLTFVLLWISSIILIIIYNFLYTVFGNLVAAITRKPIRFNETWKIVLFASTLPTILFALLNTFNIQPLFQVEIQLVVTVFFYYKAIKHLTK